jgi:hypothetical protein
MGWDGIGIWDWDGKGIRDKGGEGRGWEGMGGDFQRAASICAIQNPPIKIIIIGISNLLSKHGIV